MNDNTKKQVTKQRQTTATSKTAQNATGKSWEEAFDARRLLAIPLAAVAIYSIHVVTQRFGDFTAVYQSPLGIFMFLPFPMILVVALCCLAIYMQVAGKPIGKLAMGISLVLIVLIGWLMLAELAYVFQGDSSRACEGLFGARQSCADVGYFQAFVLLLNPLSLAFYSLLSILGSTAVIVRLKK